jgi:hypothetical protein
MISEAQVRKIALALPEVSERASYGGCPSWRTAKKMFTWIRENPRALVIWVDSLDAKEILLEHEPELFFTTSHYDGHPMLLVRMERVSVARAKEVIEESYRVQSPVRKTGTKTKTKTKAAVKR